MKLFSQQIEQQHGQSVIPYNIDTEKKVEQFEHLKINGIVLVSAGGAALVGGIALLLNDEATNPSILLTSLLYLFTYHLKQLADWL